MSVQTEVNMRKATVVMIAFLVLLPIVYAAQVTITPQVTPAKSVNIEFDQTQQFTITLKQSNTVCSLNCVYKITGGIIGKSSGSFVLDTAPDKEILTFSKQAPHRGKSSEQIIIDVDCQEPDSLIPYCTPSDTGIYDEIITLNYDLHLAEKQAKQFLDSNLIPLRENVQTFQKESYNVDSKVRELDPLALADDLRQINSEILKNYNTINSAFDNSFKEYNNEEYVKSQNLFSNSWKSSIDSSLTTIFQLKSDVDERIRQHNEAIKRLQDLIKKINDQTDLASLAQSNLEFQEVRDGAISIDKNLKSKIYKNYDEVNNAISQHEQKIEELIQKWKNIVESQTQDIKNILSLEIDKACKQADICSFVTPSSFGESFIKSTCEELNSISLEFLKFNERKSSEYQLLLNDIRNFNDKAEAINSKINELNVLTSKIEESIDEYRINIDTNNCDSAIAKLRETKNQGLLAQDKYVNLTISNCQVIYNEAEQINSKRKFQTLSGLKKLFFRIVNVFSSKKKFDNLLLYDKKTEPEKPTPLEFSVDATNSLNSVCKRFGLISKTTANLKEALTPIGQELKNVDSKEIKKIENECCIFGQCKKCCIGEQCSLDSSTYPVVLVHGFSVWSGKPLQESIDALNEFQDRLVDNGFVKVGILLPNANINEIPKGEWGKGGLPVTVRTTYYISVVNQDGKVYGVIDKNRGIKDYAKTLSEIVDILKYRTGKDKVNIIAFSMGGLVSRSYIKDFGGASNVHKLVTIGTPNNGVYDIDAVNFACKVGLQTKECTDMDANSNFIKDLKTYDISKSNVKVITVAGRCGTSFNSEYAYDNVVRVESVELPGVTNYVVECKDPSKHNFYNNFHGDLVDPDLNPQVYSYVKDFLKN